MNPFKLKEHTFHTTTLLEPRNVIQKKKFPTCAHKMRSQKLLLFSLVTTVMLFPGMSHADMHNFVTGKMREYSAWIQSENLDPSPTSTVGTAPISTENENITLQVYLRQGHAVRGHSSDINIINVFLNGLAGYFSVAFESRGNITFYGNYSGGGTIKAADGTAIPFEGKGAWKITAPRVYYGFEVGYVINYLTGRLNVTRYDLESVSVLPYMQHDVQFENLLDGDGLEEYKDLVDKSLVEAFAHYVHDLQEHPLRNMFAQYWLEVLQNTTLLEVIGYTLPPSTPRTTTTETNLFA